MFLYSFCPKKKIVGDFLKHFYCGRKRRQFDKQTFTEEHGYFQQGIKRVF